MHSGYHIHLIQYVYYLWHYAECTFLYFFAAKGAYNAHAEKRIEELQAKVREMERQNGQMKEKVSLSLNFL